MFKKMQDSKKDQTKPIESPVESTKKETTSTGAASSSSSSKVQAKSEAAAKKPGLMSVVSIHYFVFGKRLSSFVSPRQKFLNSTQEPVYDIFLFQAR